MGGRLLKERPTWELRVVCMRGLWGAERDERMLLYFLFASGLLLPKFPTPACAAGYISDTASRLFITSSGGCMEYISRRASIKRTPRGCAPSIAGLHSRRCRGLLVSGFPAAGASRRG